MLTPSRRSEAAKVGRRRSLLGALQVGLLLVASGIAEPAVAQDVVEEVIAAYGGEEAIMRIDSHRQEGMLVARGGHGEVVRISAGLGTLSVQVVYPAQPEIRIVEEGRGWRGSGPGAMAEVQGPLLLAMVAQAARARLPRLLLDLRSEIEVVTNEEGPQVMVLEVVDGLALRMYVDSDSHRIVRTESVFLELGGPFGFATEYSDFRPVDGVIFPFREETWASGVHTSSMVLGSIELNPQGPRARLPIRR